MKKTFFIFIIFSCCIFFMTSCSAKKNSKIDLVETPNISLGNEWALIIEPYAMFKEEPIFEAKSNLHCRRGDVVEVIGKKILFDGKKQSVWYKFESGWLPDNSVQIFSNKLKAQTASKKFL